MRGVALSLLAVMALGGTADAQPEPPLRIATEGAYPPFNYVDKDEPAGFEVDLARALCAAMKATCVLVLQDWDGMAAGLKERRYDAVMSSMEITPERRHKMAFSKPYYRIPAALIGPRSAAKPEPGVAPDLAGRTVGTLADSEFVPFLEKVAKGVAIRTFGKQEEANLDLLIGRLDYVLGDKLALSKFLASREGKTCCAFVADLPVDRGGGIGMGFRKTDTALRDRFDAAIDRIQADGTYDRIRAAYIPFDVK